MRCTPVMGIVYSALLSVSVFARHQTTSETLPDGLLIACSLDSTQPVLHQPILAILTFSNSTGAPIQFDLGQDRKEAIRVFVTLPNGNLITKDLSRHGGLSRSGLIELQPSQKYTQTIVLNEWYPFDTPGHYRVKIGFPSLLLQQANKTPDTGVILFDIQILPEDRDQLVQTCDKLKSKINSSSSYGDIAEAALALSYVTDPVAVPYLRDVALLHAGFVAPIAVRGLKRIDENSGIEALIYLSSQSDPTVHSVARTSLAQIMLETKDASVRQKIKSALDGK